jgi:hypothetical protein
MQPPGPGGPDAAILRVRGRPEHAILRRHLIVPAASHRGADGSRDPGEAVAAGLVTLVPAVRDQRLRNRPAAALP